MTPLQATIYRDAIKQSRKTVMVLEPPPDALDDGTLAPTPTTANTKKKKATTAKANKMYLENSSNVLMDLRKAALHPMLFRKQFTDDTLTSITRLLLKEPDFKKRKAIFELVKEDMTVMTDAELQLFMATYKVFSSRLVTPSLTRGLCCHVASPPENSSLTKIATSRRARYQHFSVCWEITARRVAESSYSRKCVGMAHKTRLSSH